MTRYRVEYLGEYEEEVVGQFGYRMALDIFSLRANTRNKTCPRVVLWLSKLPSDNGTQ